MDLIVLDVRIPEGDAAAWEKVIRQLRHRQMPPRDQPRMAEASYEAIAAYLESALDQLPKFARNRRGHSRSHGSAQVPIELEPEVNFSGATK